MRYRMLTFLFWGVGVYLLFGATLFACQRYLLFYPSQEIPDPKQYGLHSVKPVRIETSDGLKLYAWWRPPPTAGAQVIAYFHGNAGHIGYRADKVRDFLDAGYGLLLVSYRYNAQAGGSPDEDGLYEDGRAAFRFLSNAGIGGDRIAVYGESLGSAVAVTVATEHEVGAVVLEAPYTSIAAVAQSHYWYLPAKWMVRDSFDLTEKVRRIGAPLLVIHGERDQVVPVEFGRKLFNLAREPKEALFVPEAGHNDLFFHDINRRILDFLSRNMPKVSQ